MEEEFCPRELRQLMTMAVIASSFHGFETLSKAIYEALEEVIVNTELLNWIKSVVLLGRGETEQARFQLMHSSLRESHDLLALLE